jgi:NADPH-dependent F420 reductase
MTIAIIGTGNMGKGLAQLLASKGIDVVIGHRDPAKAEALAKEIGARAKGGANSEMVKLAEVVVLAVPFCKVAEALSSAGDLSGKVLVDICNPVTSDYTALTIGHTTSAAEEIQKLAPGARIVKAFNTIFAQLLPSEVRGSDRVQVFVASDNEVAKKTVSDIVELGGFEPVDSGPLSNSRYLEPVGEMNIQLGVFLGRGTLIAPGWIKTVPNNMPEM